MKATKKIVSAMLFAGMLMSVGTVSYAAETEPETDPITIDSVIFSQYEDTTGTVDENLMNVTVGFTAMDPEQITLLLTSENMTTITDQTEYKVTYIDQVDKPDDGTFEFVLERSRVEAAIGAEKIDGATLYLKMGGTGLDTMASKTIVLEDPYASDIMPGDVDGDEEVTSMDAILTLRYEAGWDLIDVVEAAMDVDNDDEATSMDAILMLRYEAGWEVELK